MAKLPRGALAALLFGNFVVACGVMVVPGMLDHLARDLNVSIPAAGHLLSLAALAMCVGAPVAAALTSHIDRRLLLLVTLLVFGLGHVACALAPDYAVLLVIRPVAVLGAAVFAPQAAATIGLMVPAHQRATAVTTVFLGWSISSVVAMPMGNLIANYISWRAAFGVVAVLAFMAALATWRVVPAGLTVPPLSLRSWLEVAASRRLRLILLSTLAWCGGQFMVLGYIAPTLRHFIDATPATLAMLMAAQGLFGLVGSVMLSRMVGRIGPDRGARTSLILICAGVLAWSVATLVLPSTTSVAIAVMIWGIGSFSFVSAQQARLAISAPELSSASIALNSSSLYAGQALGAAAGGVVVGLYGFAPLGPAALAIMLLALVISVAADRKTAPPEGPRAAHGR